MREYAKVSPRFWIGPTGKSIRALGADCQVAALYLMTSPHANMLGLYHLPIPYLCADTGLSQQGASKALARLSEAGFCSYDEASEVVWVHEMARYQIGESLKANDKQCEGVRREYKSVPDNPFLQAFADRYGDAFHIHETRASEAPSKDLGSKEIEQEQEQEQESRAPRVRATRLTDGFIPPDSWLQFCRDERPDLNAAETYNRFHDFWVAKAGTAGCKLDWFATWRNWVRNERKRAA